jgi:hypothetical protein
VLPVDRSGIGIVVAAVPIHLNFAGLEAAVGDLTEEQDRLVWKLVLSRHSLKTRQGRA